jgi:hypothetical protein
VRRPRQLLNELPGIAERSQDPAIRELNRVVKVLFPAQCQQPFLSASTLKPAGMCGGSATLQTELGAPAATQPQACSPSQGRSGWGFADPTTSVAARTGLVHLISRCVVETC